MKNIYLKIKKIKNFKNYFVKLFFSNTCIKLKTKRRQGPKCCSWSQPLMKCTGWPSMRLNQSQPST